MLEPTIIAVVLDPFSTGGRFDGVDRAFVESAAYFGRVFEDRRRAPRDDLVSGLKAAEVDIDRKALADVAVRDPQAFAALVEVARAAVDAAPASAS